MFSSYPILPLGSIFPSADCPLSVLFPPSIFLLMVIDSKLHGRISLLGLDPPTHETLKMVFEFQRLLVTATIAFFVFRD